MKVAICVITCQRLDGLKRLLDSLSLLTFNHVPRPEVSVVVVDNDSSGSAQSVCDSMKAGYVWPLVYAIEPQRGIPFARNRCLDLAKSDHDCIAFIDDDEVAESHWLDELLHVRSRYAAKIVAGPVLPYFNVAPPVWAVRGGFFDLPRFTTGFQPVKFPGTGNVLLDCNIIKDTRFEERMALTGGSDVHFFMTLYLLGHNVVWADDATVNEWVPASRINVSWILKRSYRVGNTLAFAERYVYGSRVSAACLLRLAKGLRRTLFGLVMLPLYPVLKKHQAVGVLQYISKGVGMLSGLWGRKYDEYTIIHKA